jgi:tol-pal system protein YbgF
MGPPTASLGGLGQRLRKLEQQVNNMANSDSTSRVESLQGQVQTLRGQVEELAHQLQQLQEEQKNLYADIDKRLLQLDENAAKAAAAPMVAPHAGGAAGPHVDERKSTGARPSTKLTIKSAAAKTAAGSTAVSIKEALSPKSAADQPNVAEEQQIYQTAYNLIKAKKYSEAVSALQNMLKKYPSGPFASNAHYWLGELYGLMEKNELALTEFNVVIKNYPDSPRVSDAQLKVGLILASQLKWPDAKAALKKVINHYPGTASARLASEQLKQIKQAGH